MSSTSESHQNVFNGPIRIAQAAGLTAAFEGDLTVIDTLSDCHLNVSGRLDATDATIVGGSLRTCGQGTAGTLGSEDAAPTHITLCVAEGPLQKLEAALKVLTEEQAAIGSMQKRIGMLEEDSSQFNHTEREEMTLAMFDMPDHEAAIQRLEELTTLARERFAAEGDSSPSLTVSTVLHAGVTVVFDGTDAAWTCEVDRIGPLVIRLGDDGTMTAEDSAGDIQPLISNTADGKKPLGETSSDALSAADGPLDDTIYHATR